MEPLKINFIGSLPDTSQGQTLLLSSDADYCRVSDLVRSDLAAAYQAVWVREEHHFAWLKEQLDQSAFSRLRTVTFARTTAARLLQERWELEIPPWLTDELIVDAELLSSDLPAGSPTVAVGLLSPVLGVLSHTFPTARAGAIAEMLSDRKIAGALGKRVLKAAWQALLTGWSEVSSPQWATGYCSRLVSNPRKLWSDLTAWRLLRRYPEAAIDYALDPAATAFVRDIPADCVANMTLSPEGRRLAVDQMEHTFASAVTGIVTRTKFNELLSFVSGELIEEFSEIEAMLAKAEFEIASADIAEIEAKFRRCPGLPNARLDKLSLYVEPAKPAQIEVQTPDAAAWISWSQQEYLPYRWWQIQRRTTEADVERSVFAFSEWYCQNFAAVHSDPELSAIQTIARWREKVLADRMSLILLVDNLPWFFWELLERALAAAGLHRHETKACFVPLPSHTAVCKPLVISGRANVTGSDYLKMIEIRAAEEWHGRAAHYVTGVGQLTSIPVGSDPAVVLLNYLSGDEALHGDADASGSSWSEQLGLLYTNLAKAVGDFARRVSGPDDTFGLYVVTDHGSTVILPEERKTADAQLSKKLFPNEKHRSATLSTAEAEQIPENLWTLGHRFVSPIVNDVHFIPRGHNTVASPGTKPTFCHGGATPEEVIVPSGVFRLHAASWSIPKVRLIEPEMTRGRISFYVKRIVSLNVEVQNTNNEACRVESVAIVPDVAKVRDFDRTAVAANSVANTRASLYFASSATEASTISLTFSFRIGQDQLTRVMELPVKITSAVSGGIDIKNLP